MLATVARPSAAVIAVIAATTAVLMVTAPSAHRPAHAAACAPASEQAVARLFERWNAALATGAPDQVASLYAEKAVLLPVLSERVYVGRDQIRAYFAEFLGQHPQGAVQMRATMLGCNTASNVGTFVYRVTGRRKGTRMLIGGRLSAVYAYRDGDWLIVHHHISGMFRPLSSVGELAGGSRTEQRHSMP